MREAVGGPYWNWYAGGNGLSNSTMADALVNGESCSGIFVLAYRVMGMDPPFSGTYDAASLISGAGGEAYDANKEYPVGSVFVSTSGDEGHMGIVTGPGNTTLQSVVSRGITEGLTIAETASWGPEFTPDVVGPLPGLGTGTATNAGRGAVGAAGDMVSNLSEGIAQGVAKALIRFVRAVYAITILWPIDFLSGFWWELTKRLGGYFATDVLQEADIIGILLGREDAKIPDVSNRPPRGDLFSDENKNRMFFLGAFILTYHLAYGMDRNNNSHIDNLFAGADGANIGLDKGKKGYNEEAGISAVTSRRVRGTLRGPLYEESTADGSGASSDVGDVSTATVTRGRRKGGDDGIDRGGSDGRARNGRVPDRDGSTGKFKKTAKNEKRQGDESSGSRKFRGNKNNPS